MSCPVRSMVPKAANFLCPVGLRHMLDFFPVEFRINGDGENAVSQRSGN
jgi:hypothetical protein